MLIYNTMRFGTDVFTVTDGGDEPVIGDRLALLISADALDASNVSAVNNFVITGSQPSGTSRRILFKIDNKIYRFVNGELSEYTGTVTAANVIDNGNPVAELSALSNITALVGKLIYPIIALKSSNNDNPSIRLALNITTSVETKTKTATSAQFTLPAPRGVILKITEITADIACTGSGSVAVSVRLQDHEGNWGAYIPLADAQNQDAVAVQFKFVYSVVNVGSDSAKVNSVAVNYAANDEILSGNDAEIFSIIPNFETDLRLCYLVVRHKKLIDSQINAFANFFPTPKHRERIQIGVGTGNIAQFILGVNGVPDSHVDHSSIKIFVDGVQTSNFDFNTEVGEITINATADKSILASYDYDCGLEVWHPMDVEFDQQPYRDGTYMTRFSYVLPDDYPASLANIRIQLARPSGSVENLSLGIATGKTQQIVLPHVALTDSIQLNADFTYDFDTRVLTFVAPVGTELFLSYDWRGEQHKIYSWAAGWSAA